MKLFGVLLPTISSSGPAATARLQDRMSQPFSSQAGRQEWQASSIDPSTTFQRQGICQQGSLITK